MLSKFTYNKHMQKSILIFILIVVAGLIPITIYFIETDSLDMDTASLPSRNLTLPEQQAQAFAGLLVKPVYMMLSLIIILALIGQTRPQIIALHWGQITFLAGEIFCAINFYIYKHESILSEYLHSYGMVLAFGFTSFALLEGWDMRFGSRIRSRLRREAGAIIRFIIPMLAILAFIPLLAPLQTDAYAVSILGFPYSYTRFDFYETYERRILPLIALVAFIVAYLPLLKKSELLIPHITKIFVCVGIGTLGFSFFRVALNAIFVDNLVWFEFWEETTELMFVGAIGLVLWNFKQMLLQKTPMLENIGIHLNK